MTAATSFPTDCTWLEKQIAICITKAQSIAKRTKQPVTVALGRRVGERFSLVMMFGGSINRIISGKNWVWVPYRIVGAS